MENKERVMASLGAKPIERQRKAVESAETARLRENAEKSVLKSIIQCTEVSFTSLLRFVGTKPTGRECEIAQRLFE